MGGGFYLLNKISFSFSERAKLRDDIHKQRRWRITAWIVYLIGLPPWVIIFIQWHNWIAASVEASGLLAMLLGLILAIRGKSNSPKWLDIVSFICIPCGFGYSLYDFKGFTTFNQWLETGIVIGFLVGTYLLAKEKSSGYIWYVLMHVSCGWLMYLQGYPWLLTQQIVSLVFIIDAYRISQKKRV